MTPAYQSMTMYFYRRTLVCVTQGYFCTKKCFSLSHTNAMATQLKWTTVTISNLLAVKIIKTKTLPVFFPDLSKHSSKRKLIITLKTFQNCNKYNFKEL